MILRGNPKAPDPNTFAKYRDTIGGCIGIQMYFCKSIAIAMGSLSQYFCKVSSVVHHVGHWASQSWILVPFARSSVLRQCSVASWPRRYGLTRRCHPWWQSRTSSWSLHCLHQMNDHGNFERANVSWVILNSSRGSFKTALWNRWPPKKRSIDEPNPDLMAYWVIIEIVVQ